MTPEINAHFKDRRRFRDEEQRRTERLNEDRSLLFKEKWPQYIGHGLTFTGILLFTFVLFYRPYELTPALASLNAAAFPIAIVTLAIFIGVQIFLNQSFTVLPRELICVFALVALAMITYPIAIDSGLAWSTFRETLGKVAVVFLILVNVMDSRRRFMFLSWLLLGAGLLLSYQTVDLFLKGEFKTEGYRVSVGQGMIGNPNEMSLFMLLLIPMAIGLGLGSASVVARYAYFLISGLMGICILLTQSRGGFLGLIAVGAVLIWKLGRKNKVKVLFASLVVAVGLIAFAPGNYAVRIVSIFVPSLDPVASSSGRSDLLKRSILVSLRNPQGVGIGNSPTFGFGNLETHNAFTQVSSELGILGLGAYLILLISPLRRISIIDHLTLDKNNEDWFHYNSVGLQASIIGFFVTSFFASVAFHWYIYYPIILAVCIRRVYLRENLGLDKVAVTRTGGIGA